MTFGRPSRARPSICEESIDIVKRIDLANNRRDLFGEVCGVHAGLVEPRRLRVHHRPSITGELDPFRMCPVSFLVYVITIQAGHYSNVCGFGSLGEISK